MNQNEAGAAHAVIESTDASVVALELERYRAEGVVPIITATPQIAAYWITKYKYPKQRPLKPAVVARYRDAMREGTFGAKTSIQFARVEGEMYLIDGQHRLAALVQAETPIQFIVVTHEFASLDALYLHFSTIDGGSNRTNVDYLTVTGTLAKLGINGTDASRLSGAVRLIATGFDYKFTALNKLAVREQIEEYALEYTAYMESLKGAPNPIRKLAFRSPVIAVALVTYRYAEDRARNFWPQMWADDGLAAVDPRKKLLERLRSTALITTGTGQGAQIISINRMVRETANAWNAWFEGRTLQTLKCNDENAPFHLSGTPYKTRRS